ncbi:MAG: N-acetyltransferase, partial [Ferruginibacter sp.]|nr:N-acetyltransferase [Ferruginibacter sp.]
VITKPVKDYALVVGNPARQIGWVSEQGRRINFGERGIGFCPETGQEYMLENDIVTRQ